MIKVLTSPKEIKQFFERLLCEQIEAYFDHFQDDAEMLLAIADTPAEADNIQALLLRAGVLAERRSLDVAVQRLPQLAASPDKLPEYGVFYTSVHVKKDRARTMNDLLVKIITTIFAGKPL